MEKMYVIAWKTKNGDGAGMGKKLFEREEAERLAAELNEDYPQFEHSVATAEGPEAPAGEVSQEPAAVAVPVS